MDKVLASAVRWRTRNKYGRAIDNSDLYLEVLQAMERNSATYRPGYIVWEALIDAISIGAKNSPARWKLVAKAFDALNKERPKYCPSHKLLRNGLDASSALSLPELACSLVCRSMDYFKQPATDVRGDDSSDPIVPMISVKDVAKALEVCVNARNIPLCQRILQSVGKAGFNSAGMSELYQIGLNAAAKEGNTEETERILVSMQKAGIRPG
jgi:pentatricopeptide repeat protein